MRRLIKTPGGLEAFKQRSPRLTQRQRSMFLLCDGKRGVDAVLAETATVGTSGADVDYLVAQGFLAWAVEAVAEDAAPPEVPPTQSVQGRVEEEAPYTERWTMF